MKSNQKQHNKVSLTKVYAGHPTLHNLTTQHAVIVGNRHTDLNHNQWNILYKIMAYHEKPTIHQPQSPHGVAYNCWDSSVFDDINHLIICFELADSTLKTPTMEVNT